MHKFQDLNIWRTAMEVAEKSYKLTAVFPKEEKFNLISQIRRNSVSIPSNIAEGAGRNTNGEFKQFLGIANGSSFELLTQLYLSARLKITNMNNIKPIVNQIIEVTKMNYALQKSLSK